MLLAAAPLGLGTCLQLPLVVRATPSTPVMMQVTLSCLPLTATDQRVVVAMALVTDMVMMKMMMMMMMMMTMMMTRALHRGQRSLSQEASLQSARGQYLSITSQCVAQAAKNVLVPSEVMPAALRLPLPVQGRIAPRSSLAASCLRLPLPPLLVLSRCRVQH